jgi:hypothetical protein
VIVTLAHCWITVARDGTHAQGVAGADPEAAGPDS